jgi:alkylation response protein AidB-like acyl-CoA dehydrogenase
MIGATSSMMSAFLDERVAREIYGRDDAMTAGVFAPMGRARRVADGLRVSGRWPFGSGCEHAQWRMGGVLVVDDSGEPERLPSGVPHVRCVLFAAGETEIIDTWTVSGLRGTGSHDFAVHDVKVPYERCFSLLTEQPRCDAPLYRVPLFGALAAGIAAVTLGIARAAVDALVALATKKQPQGSRRTVAQREIVQLDLARAEARLGSARAYLFQAVADASARPAGELEARARLRLAAWHATTEAAAVVDLMYNAAGATAIYATHPLQRHFRDVHVATQHAMVAAPVATTVGRVLLGLDADVTTL